MKIWQAIALVVLVWGGLYLPYLGSREIHGEEARRILPARTMLENGDWITPQIGGREYSRKPPLINWLIAASFALTGEQSERSARLPSVLWLLAFALTATVALRRRFGVWRAASVALFFLTTIAMLDKGRMAEIDAMYAAQFGIAFVLWATWWAEGRRWLAYTIPWLFLGVALLAKGPVHLVFWYPILVATLFRARRIADLFHPAHLLGILVMSGVFLPWMILNLSQSADAGEASGVWTQQLLARFQFSGIDWGKWALQPFQMLADFLPWTPLLIWGWLATRAELKSAPRDDRWVAVLQGGKIGVLAGYGILLISPEALPRYALPFFPVLTVLMVDWLGRIDAKRLGRVEGWWRGANVGLSCVLILGSVILFFLAPRLASPGSPIPLTHAAAACGFGLAALGLNLKSLHWRPLIGTCTTLIAGVFTFHILAAPFYGSGKYRPLARELEQLCPETEQLLVVYNPKHLRFLFYVERPYVEAGLMADLPDSFRYLMIRPSELSKEKFQKFLASFDEEELGRREWEGIEFVILDLNPAR